jgi:transposase
MIEVELAGLDKKVRQRTAASKPCWHLMSVPGVGPLTSLAFVTTVEARDDLERADPSAPTSA